MIEIDLSDNDRNSLKEIHQHQMHHVIRQRAKVILLRSVKLSNEQITDLTGLCETILIDYVDG